MCENYTTTIPHHLSLTYVFWNLIEVDEIRINAAISYFKYNMDT